MKDVLVTGASGFIGHRLCAELQARGVHVRALLRSEREGAWDDAVVTSLEEGLPPARLRGVDTLFHLAGRAHALAEKTQDVALYHRVNTMGTQKLLGAARDAGVRRFVLVSSVKAMGEGSSDCPDETVACVPATPYGESKLAAERLVMEGGYVPEPVVLRLSMVYGNSEKGNLPRMIRAVGRGRFPPLPETGNGRSMVHVDDVVQAAMLAAERPEAVGQTYIVTDGTPYSTSQIHAWICEALGRSVPSWSLPMPVWRALARIGDGIGRLRGRRFMFDSDALDKLVDSACYNSGKIEDELGFRPQHHLRDSLPEIIAYLEGR